jgi:membrane-bound lytic murein transglycosylase A
MFDYRIIHLALFTPVFSTLVGQATSDVEDQCDSAASSAQSSLFYDAATMTKFAQHFPDCMIDDRNHITCWLVDSDDEESATVYRFGGDGRVKDRHVSVRVYLPEKLPGAKVEASEGVLLAIERQLKYLKGRSKKIKVGELSLHERELRATLEHLKSQLKGKRSTGLSSLDAYRLTGADGRGNIQFTAYYTPVINVRKNKDAEHRFALYKRPPSWKGPDEVYLTRKQIDGECALAGQGLEIAWTKSPLDIFMMQVQGSGLAMFEDGTSQILAFGGKNGHPYVGIGRVMVEDGHISAKDISLKSIQKWFDAHPDKLEHYLYQNPSYVFFKPKGSEALGSTGLPLVAGHSIAVDPTVIPYGSVLLARVPVLGDNNRLSHHEWRLLFAQDTGAAIKGPGHIDLYTGIGEEAERKASALHHYGEVWLLVKGK